MKTALLQITSTDQPRENLEAVLTRVEDAAEQGAKFILTPEVTNCVSQSRAHQETVLVHQDDDALLAALRVAAARLNVWILIGSLALKTDDPDGRFANRSLLLAPDGTINAQYDKIHMFDVAISARETYRESDGYRSGDRAVLAQTPFGPIGMSICYDLRFPSLYRQLAQAGARILTVPAAFSPVSGAAHWHCLLRARAIETGCFVLAPAQCGTHPQSGDDPPRTTYGHSLAVSPWGEILAEAGEIPETLLVDLRLTEVDNCRKRIPSIFADQNYGCPDA